MMSGGDVEYCCRYVTCHLWFWISVSRSVWTFPDKFLHCVNALTDYGSSAYEWQEYTSSWIFIMGMMPAWQFPPPQTAQSLPQYSLSSGNVWHGFGFYENMSVWFRIFHCCHGFWCYSNGIFQLFIDDWWTRRFVLYLTCCFIYLVLRILHVQLNELWWGRSTMLVCNADPNMVF